MPEQYLTPRSDLLHKGSFVVSASTSVQIGVRASTKMYKCWQRRAGSSLIISSAPSKEEGVRSWSKSRLYHFASHLTS